LPAALEASSASTGFQGSETLRHFLDQFSRPARNSGRRSANLERHNDRWCTWSRARYVRERWTCPLHPSELPALARNPAGRRAHRGTSQPALQDLGQAPEGSVLGRACAPQGLRDARVELRPLDCRQAPVPRASPGALACWFLQSKALAELLRFEVGWLQWPGNSRFGFQRQRLEVLHPTESYPGRPQRAEPSGRALMWLPTLWS